jgi:hypothetical protein
MGSVKVISTAWVSPIASQLSNPVSARPTVRTMSASNRSIVTVASVWQ